ncbi:hypothetical protein GCM10027445_19330 [Amycolatopsis endophytica]|uniref:PH domain-containing protein n=1 Tax=Amycolatopsis endophytica TaxID=860233 RepID=A0A853BFA7_9PSEU|nr:hypothetical protein [Amycolatopsis endophytica]NYI93176.1 hypothetical protein [Amycolatopsis endophytica]
MADLGALVQSYPSENGRRLRQAVLCLAAAAVLVPLGLVLVQLDVYLYDGTPSASSMTGVVWAGSACFGLSVLLLPYGLRRLVQGLRHRGERIDLHAGGFVHHRNARDRAEFPWADVAVVDARGIWQEGKIGNRVGIDWRCVIKRTDGRKVVVNAFFPGARELADAVRVSAAPGVRR